MRKKLANQKQQQVDDEDDRIAKTVAERESKREVSANTSLISLRPVYTGDFCRGNSCNFCGGKVATSKSHV